MILKKIWHRLSGRHGKFLFMVYLTEEINPQTYHVVADICEGCDNIIKIRSVKNSQWGVKK